MTSLFFLLMRTNQDTIDDPTKKSLTLTFYFDILGSMKYPCSHIVSHGNVDFSWVEFPQLLDHSFFTLILEGINIS